MKKNKRNPQDITVRDRRAINKKFIQLKQMFGYLDTYITDIYHMLSMQNERIERIEKKRGNK